MKPQAVRHSQGRARLHYRPCEPHTERCRTAQDPTKVTNPCCRRWNALVLGDIARVFDALGVEWWIDYGTALGFATNGGLFWNDKDCDVGVLAKHRETVLKQARPELEKLGRNCSYSTPKTGRFDGGDRLKVRLSARNTTNTDVFFWEEKPDGVLDRQNYISVDKYKGREFPKDWALPTIRKLWEGVDVAVPAQVERLVAHRYGPKWRQLPSAANPAGARRTDGVRR